MTIEWKRETTHDEGKMFVNFFSPFFLVRNYNSAKLWKIKYVNLVRIQSEKNKVKNKIIFIYVVEVWEKIKPSQFVSRPF